MDHRPAIPDSSPPPTTPASAPAPALGDERISLLDALRGFALLGILPMNIPWFAYYSFAFFDPTLQGGFTGADRAAWLFGHLFFAFKMMTIFSALFGAGIIVFTTRAVERTGRSAGLFYRRLAWLLLFGLIHAYFIWEGDILVTYAVCGAVAFLFRRWRTASLVALATLLLLIGIAINVGFGLMLDMMRSAAEAVEAGTAQPWQEGLARSWEQTERSFVPTEEMLVAQRAAFEGGYLDLLPHRALSAAMFQFFMLPVWGIWRVVAVMLLGMAAIRSGVFTGQPSTRFYTRMLAIGYLVGLPIVGVGAWLLIRDDFDVVDLYLRDMHFNYVGSIFVAAGHVGLVALVVKANAFPRLRSALTAVGRTAFTNYIAHSVICAGLFYGYGLGLWGEIGRAGLWGVVVVIWALQLLWSPWWLARFQFGPLEWLWRTLTYWRVQPMRR